MSVRIRLTKTGKKHQISFRIVAQDNRTKRDGKFLDLLGFYNPHKKSPENIRIDREKLKHWLSKGAKLTEGVSKLLNQLNARTSNTINF
jgi:small subunit ribosomal protein S16